MVDTCLDKTAANRTLFAAVPFGESCDFRGRSSPTRRTARDCSSATFRRPTADRAGVDPIDLAAADAPSGRVLFGDEQESRRRWSCFPGGASFALVVIFSIRLGATVCSRVPEWRLSGRDAGIAGTNSRQRHFLIGDRQLPRPAASIGGLGLRVNEERGAHVRSGGGAAVCVGLDRLATLLRGRADRYVSRGYAAAMPAIEARLRELGLSLPAVFEAPAGGGSWLAVSTWPARWPMCPVMVQWTERDR